MPEFDLLALSGQGRDAGVVVLGHGSRAPEAGQLLGWVAERLADRMGCPVVAASLQFNQPALDDCCRLLAAGGARRIVIAPYFLFEGNHMQRDIPGELAVLKGELPEVEFILASPLGADERLVEIILARISAAGGGGFTDAVTGLGSDSRLNREETGKIAADVEPSGGETHTSGAGPMAQNPIEKQSFEIIDELLGIADTEDPEYQIVRRVIHATGDPSLAGSIEFSPGAVPAGAAVMAAGARIFCDVNMVAAGIRPTAERLGHRLECAIADPETAALAKTEGITRSAAGIRRLARENGLDGSVVVIGNAPTALLEVLRLARDEGTRPALVIGVPVGFVDASESKEGLAGSELDFISLPGNRGGSNIAVAIANALLRFSVTH